MKWIILIYLIFSFFILMLIVGFNVILLYVFLFDFFYYSIDKCFLNYNLLYIVIFFFFLILFVIVILFFNGMVLKMVIIVKGKIIKKKKVQFFILLKFVMFVCMFVIFQIIEWFVDIFDYIFVVDLMVLIQGCFVFFVFCCFFYVCGWRKNNEDFLLGSDIN